MSQRHPRMDIGCAWYEGDTIAFTIDYYDLVHITGIEEDGFANIVVFESTHMDAPVLWWGRVNLLAHRAGDLAEEDAKPATPAAGLDNAIAAGEPG